MSTTTSTTRKFSTIVSQAEADQLSAVRASQSEHAAALEWIPETESELEVAEDLVAAIEDNWGRGGDDHSPEEHSVAVSAQRRAEKRQEGAKQRLTRAAKALRSSDTGIAHAVSRVLDLAKPDVPTFPTFARVTEEPRKGDRPCILVRQLGSTEHRPDGGIAGDVEITYFRSSIEVPLNAKAFEDVAHSIGVVGQAKGFVSTDEQSGVDRLKFAVRFASPTAPVIASIEDRRLDGLASMFIADLAEATRYSNTKLASDPASGLLESSHLIAVPFGTKVESEERANGRRQLTLVTNVAVKVKVEPVDPTLTEVVANLLEGYASGAFIPALGVIEEIESLPATEGSSTAAAEAVRKATGTPTEARSIGVERVHAITLRAVLSSAATQVDVDDEDDAA